MLLRGQRLDTFGWVICKCQSLAAIREKGALQRLNSKCVRARASARLPASPRPRPLRCARAAPRPPAPVPTSCSICFFEEGFLGPQPPQGDFSVSMDTPVFSPATWGWERPPSPHPTGPLAQCPYALVPGAVPGSEDSAVSKKTHGPPRNVLAGRARRNGEQINREHCRGWRVLHGGSEGLWVRPHRTAGLEDTRVSDCSTRAKPRGWRQLGKGGQGQGGAQPPKAELGAAPPAWALVTSAPRVLTGRQHLEVPMGGVWPPRARRSHSSCSC